jgi:integrase
MRLDVKHLSTHPKSGVLRFRRAFPADLRPYIPGSPVQLTVTLHAKSYQDKGAQKRFRAASAQWEAVVERARKAAQLADKVAEQGFQPLTPEVISFLVDAYRAQELALDEEVRLAPEPSARKYGRMASLQDSTQSELAWARRVRGAGDIEEMAKYWGWVAADFALAHDIAIDQSAVEFPDLVREFHDVNIEVWEAIIQRLDGQKVPTPEEPAKPPKPDLGASRPEGPVAALKTFEDIAEDILENSVPPVGHSTREGARTALRFFREANGLLPPAKITRALVTAWIRLLAQRPAKVPASERLLPLAEIVKRYTDKPEVPRLTQKTLSQHVGHLSALWSKARRDDGEAIPYDIANPFSDRRFDIAAPPEEPQELSLDELHAIFALPIFTSHELPKRGRSWASYWMPLIMLWTGARPEEVAQLMVDDITKDAKGRWQLRVTDEGTHPVKGKRTLKTTKKGTGRRTFPIPQTLLDLNLIAYVDHLRASGETALFPALTTKGKRGLLFSVWGEWWSLHLQEKNILPVAQGRRASRELRHNWPSAARASRMPEDVREYVMGHGALKTSRGYGSEKALGEWIDQLQFEGLDLSKVKPWSATAK